VVRVVEILDAKGRDGCGHERVEIGSNLRADPLVDRPTQARTPPLA
jgi:hypothetical protein